MTLSTSPKAPIANIITWALRFNLRILDDIISIHTIILSPIIFYYKQQEIARKYLLKIPLSYKSSLSWKLFPTFHITIGDNVAELSSHISRIFSLTPNDISSLFKKTSQTSSRAIRFLPTSFQNPPISCSLCSPSLALATATFLGFCYMAPHFQMTESICFYNRITNYPKI